MSSVHMSGSAPMTLFFSSVGMLGDVGWIMRNLFPVLAFVVAVVVGKSLLVTLAVRLFSATLRTALAAGIVLAQTGESSFVLASLARGTLIGDELFQLVVSTTIVTRFLVPYLVTGGPHVAGRLLRRIERAGIAKHAEEETAPEAHVLVIGFGPTGRTVARALAEALTDELAGLRRETPST